MKKEIIPSVYVIAFLIFWTVMAMEPASRHTWFVENIILILFFSILVASHKRFRFSNTSYTLIFVFALLQTIGAHYTYSLVPLDWFTNFFEFERNHFDRIVHFSFGLLMAYPFREFLMRTSKIKNKFWSYYFPIEMAFGTGAMYEIIEWLYAIKSNPQAGNAFLGSQGDIWDAQLDMFLAGVGAALSMLITYIVCLLKKNEKNSMVENVPKEAYIQSF